MNSTEMMEVGHPIPLSTAPSPAPMPMGLHQGNMGLLPEVGHCLSELGPPVSHDTASQSSEPTSPHNDFGGGIMRITPAEVNVSCSSLNISCGISFNLRLGFLAEVYSGSIVQHLYHGLLSPARVLGGCCN